MKFSVKLSALIGLGLSAMMPAAANAAEALTLINGALHQSVTMDELNMLADEGVSKGGLHLILSETNVEPSEARGFLTQTINYNLSSADALFNSGAGQEMLADLSKVIMPRSTEEDAEQALRAAVINSLVDDNSLTPLEIVANYPVDAQVDVIELRRRNSTYAGIDEVASMLKTTQAKSKAQIANETLGARFSQTEARRQERMQAMWAGVTVGGSVAIDAYQPINGMW